MSNHNENLDLEEFRAVLRISEFIIRWIIIVSGSACVALLALIGNIWGNSGSVDHIRILLGALKWFGSATILGLLAAVAFYFTQYSSRYYGEEKVWKGWRRITICLVGAAIIFLGIGAIGLSIRLGKQLDAKADTSALEREIDELVYALYGFTPEKIKIVEGRT